MELSSWQLIIAMIAGAVTTIVGFTTFFWRRLQRRSFAETQQYQSDTLIFALCQALSNPGPRLQMAAAALLLERLRNRGSDRERGAIIQALIAATIDDRNDTRQQAATPEFCKYVADSILEVLKRSRKTGTEQSPLAPYYWQRANFPGAYWADADLRCIDFYAATLDGASLRRANLKKTVFYEASLKRAKLLGADLTDADLRAANLCGADLRDQEADDKGPARKTVWTGAKFADAIYDDGTRFPSGLDPKAAGMVHASTTSERLAS